MTPEDVERLRRHEGKIVRIDCTDGEILEAKIVHVDDEYQDVMYDLVSSTKPEKYKAGKAAAYVIDWADILDFAEIVDNSQSAF